MFMQEEEFSLQSEARFMRPWVTGDLRFSNHYNNLHLVESNGNRMFVSKTAQVLFETPDFLSNLGEYLDYSKDFHNYLSRLAKGKAKGESEHLYESGEQNGTRKSLSGKSGVEGSVYTFSSNYVVKEVRSDRVIYTEKYIPYSQVEPMIVMNELREICETEMGNLLSVPAHLGVIRFEIASTNPLTRKSVDLLIMQKVGDGQSTTIQDVERGKAYKDQKDNIMSKFKEVIERLKILQTKLNLPSGIFRDLGPSNFLINPEAFTDRTKSMFFLIDQ